MKNFFTLFAFISFLFYSNLTKAQSQNPVDLIDDVLFLAGEFADPAAQGAAYQAGAGWFTSAQALNPWKFEVSIHGNALIVPSSKKMTSISNSNDLKYLQIQNDDRAQVPTAYGGSTEVYYEGAGIEPFRALEGVDKGFVSHAFVQVTMGLPFETELTVRALPELTIDDVTFSTYGAGIKHNFSQYFKFNDEEDLQVAGIISYSKFDVGYGFNPVPLNEFSTTLDLIDVDANLWLFEVLASKRYDDFEIFGALGATNSEFDYVMGGDGDLIPAINSGLEVLGDSELQFKGDIGFNYYLPRFKISSMVTAGRFFNLNLGLHFRI